MEFFPTPPVVGNGFYGTTWIVLELNTSTYLANRVKESDEGG